MPDESGSWPTVVSEMKTQLTAAGYAVEAKYAGANAQTQIAQIEALIAKNVSCLVITAENSGALTEILASAKAKKIPVISYDRLIVNSDAVSYYITFDNTGVGVAQGKFLVDSLGANDTGKPLYLYSGSKEDNNSFTFFSGAWSQLQPKINDGSFVVKNFNDIESYKDKPELTHADLTAIINAITTNWNYDYTKIKATTDFSSASGTAYILAPNDCTARAIIDSGIGSKLTSYVISGQDAEAASLEYIKSDKQSMTIWKSHAEMAKKTAGVVNQILKGETPSIDKTIDNGVKVIPFIKGDFKLITKANVDIVK